MYFNLYGESSRFEAKSERSLQMTSHAQLPSGSQTDAEAAIACTLSDTDLAARMQGILADMARAEEVNELSDGYEFRFPGSDEWAVKLTEFVLGERNCCSFFKFELIFEPDHGPIWLRAGGSDAVKSFMKTSMTTA